MVEDKYIPNKIIEVNREEKYNEPLPPNIRAKIKEKHNLWKRYMETRSFTIYTKYTKARNKVKNMVKYLRKEKEKKISTNIKDNPKAFWKYIKSKTSIKSNIASLHTNPVDENSSLTDNNQEKADLLNEYFSSVFTKESSGNIPVLDLKVEFEHLPIHISKEIVLKLLQDLKIGKSGPDGLHS